MRTKQRVSMAANAEPYGHMTDEWIANRVYMLNRHDLEHAAIIQAARDRIMRLSIQLAEARGRLASRQGEET